jgi:hypothetical protein
VKTIIRLCTACSILCFGALPYFDSVYQPTLTAWPVTKTGHLFPFNHRYYTSEQMDTLRDLVVGGVVFALASAYLKNRETKFGRE